MTWKASPRRTPLEFRFPLLFLAASIVLASLTGPRHLRADEKAPAAKTETPREIRRDAHIDLIRGLQSEIAVAKVPLPRGKRGVYVSDKGKLDQAKANAELRENGPAIKPGMPVEITRLTFKGSHVIFEINHGGKSGKKWYQHIYIGMGTADQPLVPDNSPILAYGSWITLKAPGKVADLTVPEAKKLLSSVLDFERHAPTVLDAAQVQGCDQEARGPGRHGPRHRAFVQRPAGPQSPRGKRRRRERGLDLRPAASLPVRHLRWRHGDRCPPVLTPASRETPASRPVRLLPRE